MNGGAGLGLLILLTGLPATGKSTYCKHLHDGFGFHAINTDERPEVIAEAMNFSAGFVERYCQEHDRVVIEWGFALHLLQFVLELRSQGAKLVWFRGEEDICRHFHATHLNNDPARMKEFDLQMSRINHAGLPTSDFQLVEVFKNGKVRSYDELDAEVFRGFDDQVRLRR